MLRTLVEVLPIVVTVRPRGLLIFVIAYYIYIWDLIGWWGCLMFCKIKSICITYIVGTSTNWLVEITGRSNLERRLIKKNKNSNIFSTLRSHGYNHLKRKRNHSLLKKILPSCHSFLYRIQW